MLANLGSFSSDLRIVIGIDSGSSEASFRLHHSLLILRDVNGASLPLDHVHGLMQILHGHACLAVDQLHATIRLDIPDEVHDIAELLLERVACNLALLIFEDLHQEPLVKVICTREISLNIEHT